MLARGVIRGWTSRKHELWQSFHGHMQARGFLKRHSDKKSWRITQLKQKPAKNNDKAANRGHCHLKGCLFKLGLADHP